MNNTNFKKILVYGLPRSGTTILQYHLSKLFNLCNLSEAYTNDNVRNLQDVYAWTANQTQCVIKLLTTNVINSKIDAVRIINSGKFDLVVIPVGKKSVDMCVSLYYAERITHQYHYHQHELLSHQMFTMDLDFIEKFWLPEYKTFVETLKEFDNNGIKYATVDYDKYTQNVPQQLGEIKLLMSECQTTLINPQINYATLCQNYSDAEKLIKELTDKIC